MRLTDEQVETLVGLVVVHGQSGNWDCDDYTHGMYNGMELMLSIIENREPKFRHAPDKFIRKAVD